MFSSCDAQVAKCGGSPQCKPLLACMDACFGDSSCVHGCATKYPAAVATVIDYFACANAHCGGPCGPGACATYGVAGDGKACGAKLGGTANPDTLYSCRASGAAWKTIHSLNCPSGCKDSAPGHAYCAGDPCSPIVLPGTSSYCGAALGAPDDPNVDIGSLYTCTNGVTQSVQKCPNGCSFSKCL